MADKKRIKKALSSVKPNMVDRVVGYFSPESGVKRHRARQMMALSGGYASNTKSRKSLGNWSTSVGADADSDIIPDLQYLRDRSRDMSRNNSLASGAISTKVTSIVGTGLKLHSEIDYEFLGLSREEGEAWQVKAEREFSYWSRKKCDIERKNNFSSIQALALRATLESGDSFAVRRFKKHSGELYGLKIQLVEADRVCNENYASDTSKLVEGVEKDGDGCVSRYHIANGHPGRYRQDDGLTWVKPSAYDSKTGLPNVLHLVRQLRPHQSRGVPELAPVMALIKQLGEYKQAEVDAAVVTAMLTVFIKSESGDMDNASPDAGSDAGELMELGSGSVIGLAEGEDITTVDPSRPNVAFDGFVQSLTKEIGMALELPFEVLTKHFNSSYSASQAAMMEAWRYFRSMRQWLVDGLCDPVYEMFLYEAVSSGRLNAPGFFNDPMVRQAYCGSRWVGEPKGQIDEMKAVNAAEKRIELELSTKKQEAAGFGSDFGRNHVQRAHEEELARKDGTDVFISRSQLMNEKARGDDGQVE